MLISLTKSLPTSLVAGVCLTLAGFASAQADEAPDRTDLLIYVLCSDTAAERPLSMAEAVACGRIFDRVKLAFVSNVSLEEYVALPTREQHSVGLIGYARFRDWYDSHPEVIAEVRAQILTYSGAARTGG